MNTSDKIQLTIYGRKSSNREYLRHMVSKMLERGNVSADIEIEEDVKQFIKLKLPSIPSIRIGQKEIISFEKNSSLQQFTHKVNKTILKALNYPTMKKIIIPIDFSINAENALLYALNLFKNKDCVFHIVHVFRPSLTDEEVAVSNNFTDLEQSAKDRFEEYVDKINKLWLDHDHFGQIIESDFISGFAAKSIIDFATEKESSLIVMGAKGKNKIIKQLFGSVSLDVALKSDIPVLLVPEEYELNTLNKITLAVASPKDAETSIELVSEIAKQNNADLNFVHVQEEDANVFDEFSLMKRWSLHYPKSKLSFDPLNGDDVSEALLHHIEENNTGLLVSSRTFKPWISNIFKPSANKSLAIELDIPLLIV